jgi:hypothetical protein
MNEHLKRVHNVEGLSQEQFMKLETCLATKPTEKSSYRALAPITIHEDFRHESRLEMKVGLLKCNMVFVEGEEKTIGKECLDYFANNQNPNPYYDDVMAFLETARSLCSKSYAVLCRQQAMRNADGNTTTLTFDPVENGCQKKYAQTVASLVYFVTKCPWDHSSYDLTDVVSILKSVFFEPHLTIRQNFMTRYITSQVHHIDYASAVRDKCLSDKSHCLSIIYIDLISYNRKFIQMSYITFGCGHNSRNAQFIVHQCVGILYAMRVVFLHHCLTCINPSSIHEPERISKLYLNSRVNSSFTALQNIKRPAKSDIPEFGSQKITWQPDSNWKSLLVHSGNLGLDRVPVSHEIIRNTFNSIVLQIRLQLTSMGIRVISFQEFVDLKDSSSSSRPGEGMQTFNPSSAMSIPILSKNDSLEFLSRASNLYRLALAAIHLAGGPSPRGSEDAVTRLLNSSTELVRNVQLIHGTIGVANGYGYVSFRVVPMITFDQVQKTASIRGQR